MATRRYGDVEWNEAKARRNLRIHGVSFEEAVTTFADPVAIEAADRFVPGRFILIGYSDRARVLFVVHAEYGERTRIISVRRASAVQRRKYEEGGRHSARFPRAAHAVVIDPELWPHFGSADTVNDALRTVVKLAAVAAKTGEKSKGRRAA